jgi:hypothetical protein
MKINDEMLSAFLDAALPERDMEQVRLQLLEDEQLTERLADLAMVDTIVQQYYAQIDQHPLPDAVLQLVDDSVRPQSAEIIHFPWWKRTQQQLQQHAAAVACVALLGGYGLSQLTHQPQHATAALGQNVLQLLNNAPSGNVYAIDQQQLTPRLSFINLDGDFCRQYALQSASAQTENIACRKQGEWTLKATLTTEPGNTDSLYQTASGGSVMDSILDTLMAGPALNTTAEQQYLTQRNNEQK